MTGYFVRAALVASAMAFPLFASAAQAEENYAGAWRTNNGDMRLDQDGDRVTGSYDLKGGRVRGHVDGESLSGIWAQDTADRRCRETRMGTHYWGHFRFDLNDEADHFDGSWSYCDESFGSGGTWSGDRRHHHHHHDDRQD
jgi:hypothetical protein